MPHVCTEHQVNSLSQTMPRSKKADAARMREERGAEARAQEKVALQSEVMPEAKRSKRSNKRLRIPLADEPAAEAFGDEMPRSKEDDAARKRDERSVAAQAHAAQKQKLQAEVLPTNDAERKRREREDAAQAQAAKKVKLQDAVFPTSDAERKKESYEPSSEAHGGSRKHAGRPRELSRGQRDYENMVAVATKQRLLWDTQNAAAGDAALGACAPVKLAADGTLQCVHPKHHTCDNCPNPGAGCEAITALYAAATGVALVMEQPPGRVSELIRKCVHVSDEKKAQLVTDWEAADMAHGLPIPGCASCGNRDPTLEYSKRNVSELPTYFRLNVQRCRELELLGADGSNGVDLYSSDDGSASRVDHFSGCQFMIRCNLLLYPLVAL